MIRPSTPFSYSSYIYSFLLQRFNTEGTIRNRGATGSPGSCLGVLAGGSGGSGGSNSANQVMLGFGPHQYCDQEWQANPIATSKGSLFQLLHAASPGMCLTADGTVFFPL
jgi:hypothetical protein